ncbi:hypothetical protein IIA79_01505 [bacterium]|nr:hypothetical protein [bacterium]
MPVGEVIGIWVAAGLTLMMFSFIYRDNAFFKFGEHLYLGISVGYFINIQYWQVLVPDVYREFTIQHNLWVLVPAVLGVFILLRVVPSLAWLSRMSFALYIGGFSGLAVPNIIHNVFLPQLSQTLVPFNRTVGENINQAIILVGVLTVLVFFFFSLEHKKLAGGISRVGLFFIMVSFGAAFGYTVMARISLLIGRFQFLIFDWFQGVILGQA